ACCPRWATRQGRTRRRAPRASACYPRCSAAGGERSTSSCSGTSTATAGSRPCGWGTGKGCGATCTGETPGSNSTTWRLTSASSATWRTNTPTSCGVSPRACCASTRRRESSLLTSSTIPVTVRAAPGAATDEFLASLGCRRGKPTRRLALGGGYSDEVNGQEIGKGKAEGVRGAVMRIGTASGSDRDSRVRLIGVVTIATARGADPTRRLVGCRFLERGDQDGELKLHPPSRAAHC